MENTALTLAFSVLDVWKDRLANLQLESLAKQAFIVICEYDNTGDNKHMLNAEKIIGDALLQSGWEYDNEGETAHDSEHMIDFTHMEGWEFQPLSESLIERYAYHNLLIAITLEAMYQRQLQIHTPTPGYDTVSMILFGVGVKVTREGTIEQYVAMRH